MRVEPGTAVLAWEVLAWDGGLARATHQIPRVGNIFTEVHRKFCSHQRRWRGASIALCTTKPEFLTT